MQALRARWTRRGSHEMTQTRDPVGGRWARLRFSIVGQLLIVPPPRGGLKHAIAALTWQERQHPVSGKLVRFGASTIGRWYCAVQAADQDPVSALARRRRRDAGRQRTISPALAAAVEAQYKSLRFDGDSVLERTASASCGSRRRARSPTRSSAGTMSACTRREERRIYRISSPDGGRAAL